MLTMQQFARTMSLTKHDILLNGARLGEQKVTFLKYI